MYVLTRWQCQSPSGSISGVVVTQGCYKSAFFAWNVGELCMSVCCPLLGLCASIVSLSLFLLFFSMSALKWDKLLV